jgi:predicted metalloprotease with PDZ domain
MMDLRPRFRHISIPILILAALVLPCCCGAAIQYRVSLADPGAHTFHVTMTVPVEGRELVTALPAWNTLYRVRDFSQRIETIQGICAALTAMPLSKRLLDKDTWRFSLDGRCQVGDHNSFQIDYWIEWDSSGPFNSQLNARHAFINLAEILMYIPDRRNEEVSLRFVDVPAGWQTAAELVSAADLDNAYAAESYDQLVDAPVEAGAFDQFRFEEGGGNFRVIVDSPTWKKDLLERALHSITGYELKLMGGPPFDPPMNEYTFIFHVSPDGDLDGGGMEHRNSTAISASSTEGAVAVAAHEFFHVWNVKRIRPQALEPVDYTKEQYTRALWFAEGVTSTYAAFALERTGLWSKDRFYTDLAEQIGDLQARPARKWQSVEESSLDAWYEKYDLYNTPEHSINYYNKGQLLGDLLDLSIRDATDNHKSLDDVMRLLYAEYPKQGKFYDERNSIRAAVEQVAGKSFEDFFARYVAGTDDVPFNQFLSIAGLETRTAGNRIVVGEVSHPSDRQRRIRDGFLRGTTD